MMSLDRATIDDLVAILEAQSEFWGERDLSLLHHPMFVHEFGETALVVRGQGGVVLAYLFGFVTLEGRVGYVHLVAVRSSQRREGLGRLLYREFESLARERGAVAMKALTRPSNAGSIEFHRSLGMAATEVADYAGAGETRVVLWRALE
jgi:ribosomal protein S18 acetylase RimI-like enzyme